MFSQDQVTGLHGATAYAPAGDKSGKIGVVYYDDRTDEPTWITVHTGLFGTNETFVPVQGAQIDGDRVTLAYDKGQGKDAPNLSEDGHLSPQDEQQLYRHYGVDYGSGDGGGRATHRSAAGYTELGVAAAGRHAPQGDVANGGVEGRAAGRDTSGPNTDEAMTRSEERLNVGTETHE